LIFGQLAHGASWPLLVLVALHERAGARWLEFGWLHLVALGWVTLTALSILIHVIPAFTDAEWRVEKIARGSLSAYALGVLLLVTGFCVSAQQLLPWAGALIWLGLLGYIVPAGCTLAAALQLGKTEAAVARSLGVTLAFLFLTATLGVSFTAVLAGHAPGTILSFAPAHAEFGILGWLTILLFGVSVKTIGPISGSRSRVKWRHIASAACVFVGTLLLAAGSMPSVPGLLWAGVAALACGVVLYTIDMGVVLSRATVAHRAPQAFILAALTWLVVGLVLFVGALCGFAVAKACAYVVLMGWIGQMVNAHMHHIGVRVLITAFRGDEDETRPGDVLCAQLSWAAFVLFQVAIAGGAVALSTNSPGLLTCAAIAGGIAWLATVTNAAYAIKRLRPGAMRSQHQMS
jgi:hypothetical protein